MISRLFYTDDALFMGEWLERNFKKLASILRCFHISLGLKVKFNKSKVFEVVSMLDETTRWLSTLGCESTCLPFTYLGGACGC